MRTEATPSDALLVSSPDRAGLDIEPLSAPLTRSLNDITLTSSVGLARLGAIDVLTGAGSRFGYLGEVAKEDDTAGLARQGGSGALPFVAALVRAIANGAATLRFLADISGRTLERLAARRADDLGTLSGHAADSYHESVGAAPGVFQAPPGIPNCTRFSLARPEFGGAR